MPGIGGSRGPGQFPTTWARCLAAERAARPARLPQADVLGISWGGGLAQQFAASRPPARVRRLVLVATAPGALMVPGHPRVLVRLLTPRRHQDPGHAARIAGELYGGSARENPVAGEGPAARDDDTPGPGPGYTTS